MKSSRLYRNGLAVDDNAKIVIQLVPIASNPDADPDAVSGLIVASSRYQRRGCKKIKSKTKVK